MIPCRWHGIISLKDDATTSVSSCGHKAPRSQQIDLLTGLALGSNGKRLVCPKRNCQKHVPFCPCQKKHHHSPKNGRANNKMSYEKHPLYLYTLNNQGIFPLLKCLFCVETHHMLCDTKQWKMCFCFLLAPPWASQRLRKGLSFGDSRKEGQLGRHILLLCRSVHGIFRLMGSKCKDQRLPNSRDCDGAFWGTKLPSSKFFKYDDGRKTSGSALKLTDLSWKLRNIPWNMVGRLAFPFELVPDDMFIFGVGLPGSLTGIAPEILPNQKGKACLPTFLRGRC